jgi:hypothetical protein
MRTGFFASILLLAGCWTAGRKPFKSTGTSPQRSGSFP